MAAKLTIENLDDLAYGKPMSDRVFYGMMKKLSLGYPQRAGGITDIYSAKSWYDEDGYLHRDDDLPAVIFEDGSQAWYQHGYYMRADNKPCKVYADGTLYWVDKEGRPHREDKPAIEYSDGRRRWFHHGMEYNEGL